MVNKKELVVQKAENTERLFKNDKQRDAHGWLSMLIVYLHPWRSIK